jgi:DNA-binding transcriptional LysR family regulator
LRLFDRLPRGWQLTVEGEELMALAERMEEESFAFERAAIGAGALRGTVRISAPPSFASLFLVPRIAAMREHWPNIQLEIFGELRAVNLARREADLALRFGRPQDPGLVVRALGRIGMGLYGRVGYTERDETQWEFVGFEERLSHLAHHRWLMQFAGKRRLALRSNDQIAVHGAVRAGLGLGLIPHFEALGDPELVLVPTSTTPPPRELWLVLHADVRRSPRVRAIADLIAGICDEASVLLAG